jgi:hypothetical protein
VTQTPLSTWTVTPSAGRRVGSVARVVVGRAVVVGARVVVVGAAVVVVRAELVSGCGAADAGGAAAVRLVPSGADIRSTIVNTARNATKTKAARAVGPGFTGTPS